MDQTEGMQRSQHPQHGRTPDPPRKRAGHGTVELGTGAGCGGRETGQGDVGPHQRTVMWTQTSRMPWDHAWCRPRRSSAGRARHSGQHPRHGPLDAHQGTPPHQAWHLSTPAGRRPRKPERVSAQTLPRRRLDGGGWKCVRTYRPPQPGPRQQAGQRTVCQETGQRPAPQDQDGAPGPS